jgi:hypothetical protein
LYYLIRIAAANIMLSKVSDRQNLAAESMPFVAVAEI